MNLSTYVFQFLLEKRRGKDKLIHSSPFKKNDADRNPRIIREHRMSP